MESFHEIEERAKRLEALIRLTKDMRTQNARIPITFNDFLYMISDDPALVFRDIFQLFHDMVRYYIPPGKDDFEVSEDSIGFVEYDCSGLFQKNCDDPFFADRLFANRFMNLVKGFKKGIQNNRIYLFEGPPGSGKSTFLDNLLSKMEEFTCTADGAMYNTLWRLNVEKLGGFHGIEHTINIFSEKADPDEIRKHVEHSNLEFVDVSCPNGDHPILQIPKNFRKQLLEELITNEEFKEKLFHNKEYEWVFKDVPCGICMSIYNSLMDQVRDPMEVFNMLHAKRMTYSRQFGEGISIFNPGDPVFKNIIKNPTIQSLVNQLLKNDSVKYIHSYLANTNNGIFALMDIKENNVERLMDLHGIISDGVHKVELVEERIKSIFVGLVNPEDRKHYENVKSFRDRIVTVNIPYILDYNTEVSIYKNKFDPAIELKFLPRVLQNFAKLIISTRMEKLTPAVRTWIQSTDKYSKFVDTDLLLLKMEVYTGKIPTWLKEDDIKRFDRKMRKDLIDDSEKEGKKGYSGRQSLSLFNAFLTKYADNEQLITMEMVREFFESKNPLLVIPVAPEFISSLVNQYNYYVLQEVKESIYYFNKIQIVRDIKNYLYAVNFDEGETVKCEYTGDTIEISEDYFKNFEALFLGTTSTIKERQSFRRDIIAEYITTTLAQEIGVKGKRIDETTLFGNLFEKYTRNLKQNALAPYLENENFRRAILDYGQVEFNKYDRRLQRDINRLIDNLERHFGYREKGAQQVAIYVLDNDLAKKY